MQCVLEPQHYLLSVICSFVPVALDVRMYCIAHRQVIAPSMFISVFIAVKTACH